MFRRLRENAELELERANRGMENLRKQYDEATVAVRARLRQKETEVESLSREVDLKSTTIRELNGLVNTLIHQAEENGDSISVNGDLE